MLLCQRQTCMLDFQDVSLHRGSARNHCGNTKREFYMEQGLWIFTSQPVKRLQPPITVSVLMWLMCSDRLWKTHYCLTVCSDCEVNFSVGALTHKVSGKIQVRKQLTCILFHKRTERRGKRRETAGKEEKEVRLATHSSQWPYFGAW